MTYVSDSDLLARVPDATIISLTDHEQTATGAATLAAAIVLNSEIRTRVDAAYADADGTVNSYLRTRYSVPLTAPIPAQILRIAVDLTLCALHKHQLSGMGIPEAVNANCKSAMDYLKDVAKGIVDLGVEPPPAASAKSDYAQAEGADRLFTPTTMGTY